MTQSLEIPHESIDSLVHKLASQNPTVRQGARQTLVQMKSREVTAALVTELTDPRDHVRWEAAKALSRIADPVSAPALVNALEDDMEGVRWLAAEGLVALGEIGVLSVLSVLLKRSSSTNFCTSAHHVLHDYCKLNPTAVLIPVLDAASGPEPGVRVPPAAYRALTALKVGTV